MICEIQEASTEEDAVYFNLLTPITGFESVCWDSKFPNHTDVIVPTLLSLHHVF